MNAVSPRLLIARGSLALLLVVAGVAAQDTSKGKPYPEHGKVIAAHLGTEAVGSAGVVGSLKRWVYRVDCGDLYYDLQGKGKPLRRKRSIWMTARTEHGIVLSEWESLIRSKVHNQISTPPEIILDGGFYCRSFDEVDRPQLSYRCRRELNTYAN